MSKRFVVADHHFYHNNIIKYANRPFNDIDQMNNILIEKHNQMVNRNDITFVLGDFSFGNQQETRNILKKMNGRKILILGNHDVGNKAWWISVGFEDVIKYPIIINDFFILSHKPVYLNDHMPYINIHGHLHSKKYQNSNYVCVSVESTDYYPINLETLILTRCY